MVLLISPAAGGSECSDCRSGLNDRTSEGSLDLRHGLQEGAGRYDESTSHWFERLIDERVYGRC